MRPPKGQAAEVVKSAIDSGVINNTKTAHDFVDFLAKTASDQGYSYTLTNKQKIIDNLIEQSGNAEFFRAAVQNGLLNNPQNADSFISEYAKTPQEQSDLKSFFDKAVLETRKDAYISGKNITLNMNSPKYMEVVVGHEITHSFEGSDLYEPMKHILFQIAKDKGEYDSRLKSIQQRYTDKDGKFIGDDKGDPEAAYLEELASDLLGKYIGSDEDFVRSLSAGNKSLIREILDGIKYLYNLATAGSKEARELERIKRMYEKAYREGAKGVEGTQYSLSGTNKDGIEVYETSQETMALTWDERRAKYLDVLKNEYLGRTAKFERNGHTYYAKFDQGSVRKHIYGDSRSSKDGVKALIKAGADGDVFSLVENSRYTGSKPNTKTHTNADYFDYFVKTVQIDGKVFDLVADVEKEYGVEDGYVYTLALVDNKKIKASPALGTPNSGPVKSAGNASATNIPQNGNGVKGKNSLSDAVDFRDAQLVNIMASNVANAARKAGIDLSAYYQATGHINAFQPSNADIAEIADAIEPIVTQLGNSAYSGYVQKMRDVASKYDRKYSLSAAGEATTGSGRFLGEDLSIASEAAPKKVMAQDVPPPPTAKKNVPKKRAQDVPPPPTANKKADAEGNGVKLPPVALCTRPAGRVVWSRKGFPSVTSPEIFRAVFDSFPFCLGDSSTRPSGSLRMTALF